MKVKTTRRVFLAGTSALLLAQSARSPAHSAAQTPGGSQSLQKELVIVASGGSFEKSLKKNFYDPFTELTRVKIRSVAISQGEQWTKVKAMTQSGTMDWDIVSANPSDFYSESQYLHDFGDCGELPNVLTDGIPGTCHKYGILRGIGGGVLAYNSKLFPSDSAPKTWADFWDLKKFPGRRALPNDPFWVLAVALYADGVTSENFLPLDLDRAFRKLDQIKPYVEVWWTSGDQSQQLWRNSEVVMSMMYVSRAIPLKNEGLPIDIVWKGAPKDVGYWSILKDAPHPEAAKAFLNFFITRPEAHFAHNKQVGADSANRFANDPLPPAERIQRATYPENWVSMVDADQLAQDSDTRAKILERWNSWLAQ
ncbi:ABC transporter substrate-binding protein [Bradyrhizobium sp. Arg314]